MKPSQFKKELNRIKKMRQAMSDENDYSSAGTFPAFKVTKASNQLEVMEKIRSE